VKALVSSSARLALTSDGRLWTPRGHAAYAFWTRYLDVYDEVRLLARAVPRSRPPEGWWEATGPQVEGAPLADFHTPREFLKNYTRMRRIVVTAVQESQAIHLRAPCLIGGIFWKAVGSKRPHGVEVVGDPYDLFAPGAFPERMRPLYRAWFTRRLRHQCARASAAAYVTEQGLQKRYPPSPGAFVTYFSDVDLGEEAFVSAPRNGPPRDRGVKLIMVGSLEQLYKAPHIVIEAVAHVVHRGLDVRLILVGEGRRRLDLQKQAGDLSIIDRVEFAGQVSAGEGVRRYLDAADLFVLPSFQEGLPKAMIEAMARGLPCIGSAVGGIPELLQPEDLVSPGDAGALAEKILEILSNRDRMKAMSVRNLHKASEYSEESLRKRRINFYRHVKQQTEAWLEGRWAPASQKRP
jgi:glycosyltransferase involved in cell wall biosynthesis